MNQWNATGRLVAEPQLKTTRSGASVCPFVLAVKRDYRDADGNTPTDFFNCVAFRQTAEFIGGYAQKGALVEVTAAMRQHTFTGDDGEKIYRIEAEVSHFKFLDGRHGPKGSTADPEEHQAPPDALPF